MRRAIAVLSVVVAIVAVLPSFASAQSQGGTAAFNVGEPAEAGPGAIAPTPEETAAAGGPASLADEQALYAERTGVERTRDNSDPFEEPRKGYYFLSAMYRQIWIPTFIQRLFMEGGVGTTDPGFGGEFTYRKNNFSISGSVWWQSLKFNGPFRSSGDPDFNTEMWNSNWSAVFAAASFMWSTPFNDYIALEYGIDVGLGVLLGQTTRTEAYRSTGPGSVNGYAPCRSAGNPNPTYCGTPISGGATDPDGANGEQYGVVARKWSAGGSVPNVVPWLALPHLALRIKPIHQVQIRIDTGFFAGFFFGGTLGYGF